MGAITPDKKLYDELAVGYFASKVWRAYPITKAGRFADVLAMKERSVAVVEVKSPNETSTGRTYDDTENLSPRLHAKIGGYFAIKRDFDYEKYMSAAWKKFQLGDPVEVRIKFSHEVAHYVVRKRWHSQQKIIENKDGSVDFIVNIAGTEEIERWILSWGVHAEVVSPESLRNRIKAEIIRMSNIY